MDQAALEAAYHSFLTSDDYGYLTKIQSMVEEDRDRLLVDLHHLRRFDNTQMYSPVANDLLEDPKEHLPALTKALHDVLSASPDMDTAEYLKAHNDNIFVGIIGSLGANVVSPRSLTARYLARLVCLEGIVTKCSLVRPKMVKSMHYCPATEKFTSREYRDATDWGEAGPTGSSYPTKDAEGNPLQIEFGLSTFKANQTVTIQEMPERAPLGQLPRSIDVLLNHDLVDACKPGDRVQIVGVYRALASKANMTSGSFKTLLLANSVRLMTKNIEALEVTDVDKANFKKQVRTKNWFDKLSKSLAPSIYGHDFLKKAILLMLLGGKEVVLKNGTHLRGDINVLMVGDPSTAKSQLLRFVLNIAPLAVNTTGRGSSGVGLTAAVTQDQETRERRLEAGAMVLADRGVVCIDEFDKMSDADRVAIHEVMEQQTVTIAKASIHATLNARCSVVAAANPIYGSYDKNLSPQKNVNLPDSLLSRFDFLFIVLDELDEKKDERIANHVLRMHRYERPTADPGTPFPLDATGDDAADDDEDDALEAKTSTVFQKFNALLHPGYSKGRKNRLYHMDFIKKFVHFAKQLRPELSHEARDLISQTYSDMRQKAQSRTLPVTPRTLETLIRVSTAHAKARLSKVVEKQDVEAATAVLSYAMYHEADSSLGDKPARRKRSRNSPVDGDDAKGDENMDAGAGAGAAAGSGPAASDGESSDASMGADEAVPGRRPRKSRRTTRSSPAAAPSPARSTRSSRTSARRQVLADDESEDEVSAASSDKDVDMQRDSGSSDSSEGSAAGSKPWADEEFMARVRAVKVNSKSARYKLCVSVVSRMFRGAVVQCSAAEVMDKVNERRGEQDEFDLVEVYAVLGKMYSENKVFFDEGIVNRM